MEQSKVVKVGETTIGVTKPARKIVAVQAHVGQLVTGQVRVNINAAKADVDLILDEEGHGIVVRGKNTNKVIAWSNIQSYDFEEEGQPKPLVQLK